MKKVYYFVEHSGNFDQLGREYTHWNVSFHEYDSKKELRMAKCIGRTYVRLSEIYTPEALIEKFSKEQITRIVREVKRNRPDLFKDHK